MRNLRSTARRLLPGAAGDLYTQYQEYRRYRSIHGRTPNVHRPRSFTEKVIFRKLYDKNYLYTKCSDKYLVRDYVAKRVGSDVLVPLLFKTAEPDELLSIDTWANTVLKPNHGSLMVEIISAEEPSFETKIQMVGKCKNWLSTDYSVFYNEWHYSRIERQILVEAFVGERGHPPLECKVHCFPQRDGSVLSMVQMISDRFASKAMSFYLGGIERSDVVRTIGEQPPRIEGPCRTMVIDALDRSRVLCEDFNYVRVDWLVAPDKLYFSELTFTPGAGLSSTFGAELDRRLGELWAL